MLKALKKRLAKPGTNERKATVATARPAILLNSIGGVASTFLFDFIADHLEGTSDNHFEPGVALWKHTLFPPAYPFIQKAIFIHGDPILAVSSILRRNKSDVHLRNKGLPEVKIQFADYLTWGTDVFRTLEQMENWTRGGAPYPILAVKSEAIHDNIESIVDFLGISRSTLETFPPRKTRASGSYLDTFTEEEQNAFKAILAPAVARYENLPDCMEIKAQTAPTPRTAPASQAV